MSFGIRIEFENNATVEFSQLARDLAQIIPLQPALQPVRRGRCLTRRFGERFTRNMPQTLLKSGEQRRNMIQEFCTRQCIATGEIRITSDGALPGAEQRVTAIPHVAGQVRQFVNDIGHVYSPNGEVFFMTRRLSHGMLRLCVYSKTQERVRFVFAFPSSANPRQPPFWWGLTGRHRQIGAILFSDKSMTYDVNVVVRSPEGDDRKRIKNARDAPVVEALSAIQ